MEIIGTKIKSSISKIVLAEIPGKKAIQKTVHFFLAVIYPIWPNRIKSLPGLLNKTFRYWISKKNYESNFPPVESALRKPDGLLVVGGTLNSARLIRAYRNGIYPHSHIGPIKWWAPESRMVIFIDETHISKTTRYDIRKNKFNVTFDQEFEQVIRSCASPRRGKTPVTWITNKIIEAYCKLYNEGYAHSVEIWDNYDNLVGGLYGVAIGLIFFTESMFSRASNSSKIGLSYLNCHLQSWGYILNDVKGYSKFWEVQGARSIHRHEFTKLLNEYRDKEGKQSPWRVNERINVAAWNPKRR